MLEKEREKRIKVRKDKQDNGILHKRIEKKSKKTYAYINFNKQF